MNSVSSATPSVAPLNFGDVVAALPPHWEWIAAAVAVMAIGAYSARAALTPQDLEPLGSRQAREIGGRR